MSARMGEYLVGAYLTMIQECDFVTYNVRFPEEGLKGLSELDVVGFDFKNSVAYLCEVSTHILGFFYGLKGVDSVKKVLQKFDTQKEFAEKTLKDFKTIRYQFWSPRVGKPDVEKLNGIVGLESIVNETYTNKINELKLLAKKITRQINNPAFRVLQILEHMKKVKN